MKKKAQVTIPAQRHFSIGNWSFLDLTVSPTLYARNGDGEPYEYYEVAEFSSAGGRYSTGVRTNDHGQRYSYVTASHELLFKSSSTEYRFNAYKFGNQVTYSTPSPGAAVLAHSWIFEDFIASIELEIKKPATPADRKAHTGCEFQVDDQPIQYSPSDPVHPAPEKKVSQVVIADTDKFSFLSNVNIYFSGCDVYQDFPPGQIHKVDRHGEGNPRVATEYYLTQDKSYPAGVTTLTIKDGFSEAKTVVEFDHDTSNKRVTMTIKSFTSTLCDIRDFSYLEKTFPNTICIAL
ncbi:hypothetical protein [Pseudomonas sp. St316]|uniref:hypothetical protein n=1 Tax=Pseudomonas sp. St316 TaxID=2678257 RepID=UPI001BB4105C|nr:hypothetical protein [Pseudomonas sp. St316]BBP58706.1 hypothetical protein PHLH4_22960 [Pseudomonas sp. St316]